LIEQMKPENLSGNRVLYLIPSEQKKTTQKPGEVRFIYSCNKTTRNGSYFIGEFSKYASFCHFILHRIAWNRLQNCTKNGDLNKEGKETRKYNINPRLNPGL